MDSSATAAATGTTPAGEDIQSAPIESHTTVDTEMSRRDSVLGPKTRSPVASVFAYIMKQSYAGSLIIMMVGGAGQFNGLVQDCGNSSGVIPVML